MVKKLLELIKMALQKMLSAIIKSTSSEESPLSDVAISDKMADAIELWRDMYKDCPPWENPEDGIYTMNLAKQICQAIQQQVLSELETHIQEPGVEDEVDMDKDNVDKQATRAQYLDDIYHKRLIQQLPEKLEKALALGGMIIKPYFTEQGVYIDFVEQGQFYPLAYDNDRTIISIAFPDWFISDGYMYTKIEYQTFDAQANTVTVLNKAYRAKIENNNDIEEINDIGDEYPLENIPRWAGLPTEPKIVEQVERPLYGYFRVPLANNIDMSSPLGVSIFSPARKLIEYADRQFSRLDWEYEGGQIAIDVDPTAVDYQTTYYGNTMKMDECKNRLYRKIDLGQADTYQAFAPALRDTNYNNGLNTYLMKIEDIIGISRGTLSQVEAEARTATEIKLLKQRTYITISNIQEALEKSIMDAVYAMNVFTSIMKFAPEGDYDTKVEWKDSVLTDTDTELNQKLQLVNAGVLSKAELRSWYTGETLESAKLAIDTMAKENQERMLNDIYSQDGNTTLESTEEDEDEEKTRPTDKDKDKDNKQDKAKNKAKSKETEEDDK